MTLPYSLLCPHFYSDIPFVNSRQRKTHGQIIIIIPGQQTFILYLEVKYKPAKKYQHEIFNSLHMDTVYFSSQQLRQRKGYSEVPAF